MGFWNPEHGEIIADIKELTGRKCYFKFIDFCNEALGVNVSEKYNKSLTELQCDFFYSYIECYIYRAEILNDFTWRPFIQYSLLPADAEQAKELLKDFTVNDNLRMYQNIILEVSEQYISEIENNDDFIERTKNNI